MCRSGGGDRRRALEGGGRHQREPEPAVGGEALLRREVVDVGLAHVDRQAAGARGGVDEHQRVGGGARGTYDGRHHGGRGLVVRPGVDVDAVLGDGDRPRAGLADLITDGSAQPRRGGGRGGELRGELAERQVLALLLDQPEGRDVPERRRAAVAEHDLVAVGQREQVGQPGPHPADEVAHRRLAVRGAHQRRAGRGERVEVRGLDLRRSGTEAPVGGQQVGGDLEGVGHENLPNGVGEVAP